MRRPGAVLSSWPPRTIGVMANWQPQSQPDWIAYAAYLLRGRGVESPSNEELQRTIFERGGPKLDHNQVTAAKRKLWNDDSKKFTGIETLSDAANWVAELLTDPIDSIMRYFATNLSDADARRLARITGLEPFTGNLCWLTPAHGLGGFRAEDVAGIFDETPGVPGLSFSDAPSSRFEAIRQLADDRTDALVRAEIDSFWATGADLGANHIRPMVSRFVHHPEDYHGTVRPRLTMEFVPTDWRHVKGFNNRLAANEDLNRLAEASGWLSRALPLPLADASVPSYTAAVVILTGRDYLAVTQRPDRFHVEYAPEQWSMTMEENMQGPRDVRDRNGQLQYKRGDGSLHEAAGRGLREELGLEQGDLSSMRLLGLFAEAPYTCVVGVFWASTPLSWQQLKERFRNATDPEAKVLGREPLSTENMVELCLLEQYVPSERLSRHPNGVEYFSVSGRQPTANFLHPSSRSRMFRYLLDDSWNHPPDRLVEAFKRRGVP